MIMELVDKYYSYYFDNVSIVDKSVDDIMYFLAECENGPGLYYDWDSQCIEDLEGALFNMHGAITDLRKFW